MWTATSRHQMGSVALAKSRKLLSNFAQDTRGSTAIEYGLICALIFIAIVASVGNMANATKNMFNNIKNQV